MKTDLRKLFEEEYGCQFSYEIVGKFPKYNKKTSKWRYIERGTVWKAFAEWLEQKLSQTIADIPTFIIPYEKEVYDDVEIHPVCEEKGVCSVCDEGDAHFWSVYLHVPKKGIRCIADLKTRNQATQFADLIEFLLNLQDE